MALTDKEIAQFATFRVEFDAKPRYEATPEQKAKLLKQSRLAATAYYETVQADVKESGHRVTKRVKDIIWRTLKEIEGRELAPCTVPAINLSRIAMTTGGEKVHPVVIVDGNRMRWVGFGWINEDEASREDMARYPLAV